MTTEIEMTKPPLVANADVAVAETARRRRRMDHDHPFYKWVVLSNTTLGMLLATDQRLDRADLAARDLPRYRPQPARAGQCQLSAVDADGLPGRHGGAGGAFGRLGDMFGRVRIYNLGFVVFTVAAVALSFDPFHLGGGALWLIGWRVVQGVGGAMLMASSAAILTDAFPSNQRGMALGVNMVAAVAGSFLGLLIGGVLSEWHWKAIFWVGVPIGMLGTVWSMRSLQGTRRPHAGPAGLGRAR